MSEQKGTRMHYVDQVEYDKTWKERLIYWGDRLREKVYRQKNEIATLQARAEKAEQNLVDCKASRVMCGERAMRLEQELIALKAGIPVVVGYVTEYEAFGLRQPDKDSAPWVGYRQSSKRFVPVYLDPQPPSKEPT
jgi:hypothetical protein